MILLKSHEDTFKGCDISEHKDFYSMGDFNANLLHKGNNIFNNNWYKKTENLYIVKLKNI